MLNYITDHAATVVLNLRNSQVYTDCDQMLREEDGALTLTTFISDWDDSVIDPLTTMQAIVQAAWSVEEDRPFPGIPWRPVDPTAADFELPF